MPLLLDTGILYALADADDDWHQGARAYVRRSRDVLMTPISVVPEVAYLLHTRLGARVERLFVESLVRGEISVEPVESGDLARCAELLRDYPDLGFVDVSIVAVAERLKTETIATTDRRHFGGVRPRHVRAFTLVP